MSFESSDKKVESDLGSIHEKTPDKLIARSTSKSIGVRKAELLIKQYSHPRLRILLFFCVFLCSYAFGLDFILRNTFQTYATNSYKQHSLLATVNVIKGVVATASQPVYARLSDRFGRLEIFIVAVVFYVIGTIIQSQAYDVNRFAAGSVFFQLGYSGCVLALQIIVADASNLNWRVVAMFVPVWSNLINTWVSGNIASSLLANHSWNYCIGIWAFIFPLSCIPLVLCFVHMYYLVKKNDGDAWDEVRKDDQSHYTWVSIKDNFIVDIFWEIDLVGALLIVCIFGFILVPLTIAGGVNSKWQRASTIAPLVIGFVLIPVWIIWELKFSKFPITPFPLLKDRGVWAAMGVGSMIYFVYEMPVDYLYTILVVGMNQSIRSATRINSLYTFVMVITGSLYGLVVVKVRKIKPFIIFGVCCWFIGMGLLVHFRGGHNNGTEYTYYVNGIIGSLCFLGFGAGFFTYATQVSISACTSHEYMAVIISIFSASYHLGNALGACVSGAVWTNTLYKELHKRFAANGLSAQAAEEAYQSPFTFIRKYKWGTPERIEVVKSYATVQRILCIIGLALVVLLFIDVFFLRDHELKEVQSLEFKSDSESSVGDEKDSEVVVNKNDKDIIVDFFGKIFKRSGKNEEGANKDVFDEVDPYGRG